MKMSKFKVGEKYVVGRDALIEASNVIEITKVVDGRATYKKVVKGAANA
jgi:hypothetical protein